MKNRRKAELQRKLSATPLQRPPAGLAERIKRDIPQDLRYTTDDDRARFSMFNTLSLRVAASILILVGGAYFAIRLMSEANHQSTVATIQVPQTAPVMQPAPKVADEGMSTTVADHMVPAAPVAVTTPASLPRAKAKDERREGRQLQIAANEEAKRLDFTPPPPPAAPVAAPVVQSADAATSSTFAGAAEPQKKGDREIAAQNITQTAEAPLVAPAPAPLRAERDTLAKTAAASEAISVNAAARRPELFGISVDHQAFDRIKFAIEHGDRPAASSVDVAALVNYFAGAPNRIRHDAALDLEASSRPVRDGNTTALVRVSVDTLETIYDATLEMKFDPVSVSEYHRIGGDNVETATESAMQGNRSVTALYEVQLRPHVRARQAVATATLTYRSSAGRQTLTRWVSYAEALEAWKTRSRRHRLATLGAIWAQTLRAQAAGTDVAMKAEELSKQEPRDEKAKELATLATASSRLRTSSPTGSGR